MRRFRYWWCGRFHSRFHSPSGQCHKCHWLLLALMLCVLPAYGQSLDGWADYRVVNLDKLLVGTDKLIYAYPPEGKYWVILQGSLSLAEPVPGTHVMMWMENAPYAPYRDPQTGEMQGCLRCVTLMREPADKVLFPIKAPMMPLIVAWPHRLMFAVSVHGALPYPVQTWTRLVVVERDLPTP